MAVDIFLVIPGVKGETADADFAKQNAIDVQAWNWGMSQAGSAGQGSGSGVGKVNVNDIQITKFVDKSTPVLMAACCAGTAYGTSASTPVIISMRKAGGKSPLVYMAISLFNVTVSGVTPSTSSGTDMQSETLSLHFGAFQVVYTPQDKDGIKMPDVTMTWNIAGNSSKLPG
jgi:type VI secretion system secreted protein Hcp